MGAGDELTAESAEGAEFFWNWVRFGWGLLAGLALSAFNLPAFNLSAFNYVIARVWPVGYNFDGAFFRRRLWEPGGALNSGPFRLLYKGRDMPAQVGDTAPEFTLPSVSEGDISLSQYKGEKNVVLSFHVFDFTSG